MGRTNGKLIPFLRNGLMLCRYENLYYEPDSDIFDIDFPRYDRGRSMYKSEKILKDWYRINGKRYDNYSTAKAVFQASLKKSVHLVSEASSVKKLRYRFANEIEIKENRRIQKEKEKKSCKNSVSLDSFGELDVPFEAATAASNVESLFPNVDQFAINPPSVQSSSSGYSTGEEAIDIDSLDLDFILGVKVEKDLNVGNTQVDGEVENDDLDLGNIEVEDLFKPVQQLQSVSGVQEMNFTPVDISQYVKKKTYWICNKKLNLDSVLQLICKKQIIEEGNGIEEGSVIVPNEVWEPGISYDLKMSCVLDDKLFLLLARRV